MSIQFFGFLASLTTMNDLKRCVFTFTKPPVVQKNVVMDVLNRELTDRLSMPWMVYHNLESLWTEGAKIVLLMTDSKTVDATIVNRIPIVSTSPLVIYSCEALVDDSNPDDIKVQVVSAVIPELFSPCSCGHKQKEFELCSCLVLHMLNMSMNDQMFGDEDVGQAMAVFHNLTAALEIHKVIGADGKNTKPYVNWTRHAFALPYHHILQIPNMVQGSPTELPSRSVNDCLDFTTFCKTYDEVDLYFSLCRYIHPARVRLLWKNRKVCKTIMNKIKDDPILAFLGQLIEVEGLRQAALDFATEKTKALVGADIDDTELQAAIRLHEQLLQESLLKGNADVQLYSDSNAQKLLAWMGGILITPGNSIGQLAIATAADVDSLVRLRNIANHWTPNPLSLIGTLQDHLTQTNLLFVNTRSTCGRNYPTIRPKLDYYRANSLVIIAPSDVSCLETRFSELCQNLSILYSQAPSKPVIPVVTIVDLHLFSPLMLRTALCFLLECQHGFTYNDTFTEKTYRYTRTSLPFKILAFGDFRCYPCRGGISLVNTFLDYGQNRACYYRDNLEDVHAHRDPYAHAYQHNLHAVNITCSDDEENLHRIYVDSKKTSLYWSADSLPTTPQDEHEFIGKEMGPTIIPLPFSRVHLSTTDPRHIYTALCQCAGDVILHIPKSEISKLAF